MPDNDLTFGFDTSFFEKGIDKVTKRMEGLKTTTGTVAKGISRGLTAVALKFGSVFAGVKAVQGALRNMPEIGQAFGIAKDVFVKNLLFPLRKEIFPLLQKMLDWVRDSRGLFIRWGQAIANVFRSVVAGIKNIIGFIKKMSAGVADFAQRIFGDQVKGISELFDLMAFKMATIVQFVSLIFGKVIEKFGMIAEIFFKANNEGNSFITILSTIAELFMKTAGFVLEMTDSFLDGFLPAISEIATPIQNMLDTFGRIRDMIFTSTESMETWKGIFEGLGTILGTTIMVALKAIETIVLGIEQIFIAIKKIKDEGFFGSIKSSIEEQKSSGAPTGFQRAFGNPQASATTNNNGNQTITQNVSPTIVIENGTVEEGQNFAAGFMETMRELFNQEFERSGQ